VLAVKVERTERADASARASTVHALEGADRETSKRIDIRRAVQPAVFVEGLS